jgi:hypothetical protein
MTVWQGAMAALYLTLSCRILNQPICVLLRMGLGRAILIA